MNRKVADVAGKRLSLTNLEKNLYPSYGFTKAHVLDYYRRVSPFILPHLKDRPLTLVRFPEGVEKESFFEKRCPSHRPEWVTTAEVPTSGGKPMTACLVNDLNTLMWVENLASIELHVPLSRAASPYIADSMVFDLDPGEPAGVFDSARVALFIRDLLSRFKLGCYVKTSGKKGLHVYVPLNHKKTTFLQTKLFSKSVAEVLQRNYPDMVTTNIAKQQRENKVFINWSQNDPSKTMVCVYSLRAGKEPMVSFPVAWPELEETVTLRNSGALHVTEAEALQRLETEDDLFREVLVKKQQLPYSEKAVPQKA